MGLDTRRPPLPAPTDISSSLDDSSGFGTEVATNLTTKTDKTSHTIPEDGSPITISTHRGPVSKKEGRHHQRQKSQTSLLIEYFEAGKGPDKSKNKPSVRVRVTPSSRKGSRGQDAVQITGIGKDRKPSYSRRISLSSKRPEEKAPEGTEISQSSESNVSGLPPVEVEVLNNESELSSVRSPARPAPLLYAANESNVSSMPPDSMLEGSTADSEHAREYGPEGSITASEAEYLKAPSHTRSRSASQERITQKVMEKLNQQSGKTRRSSRDYEESGHRRRRSSKSHRLEDDLPSGAESSLLSSNPTASQRSQVSSISQGSRMTNNPKLLEMVEDTIKRMILPEINAIKADQKVDRNHRTFEESRRGSSAQSDFDKSSVSRSLSKSSSTPHFASRPKVVLNRDGDDPGTVLSRGDSEYKKHRKSSRDRPSSRRSSGGRSVDKDSYLDEEGGKSRSGKSSHRARDAAAGAIAGGILTQAALKNHDSQGDVHERRKKRTKSRGTHERSASITDTADEESYLKQKLVPPMPMASRINDSDLTRDSIMSADSRGDSALTEEVHTPVREISRGSIDAAMSPSSSSRTPTRNSMSRGLGMSHDNRNLGSPDSNASTTKARIAALTAAAGLGGEAAAHGNRRHVDADGYGSKSSRPSLASPAQSVSSLRKQYEEPLIPSPLRPTSATSRPSSVGRLRDLQESPTALRSGLSSPTEKDARSRQNLRPMSSSGDEFTTPLEKPNPGYLRDGTATPTSEDVDAWYERQHLENDKYRDSISGDTNRTSYQTNPYPEDENRYSMYTQDSMTDDKRFSTFTQDSQADSNRLSVGEDVRRGAGANAQYVNHPAGLESAVASLVDPSTMSSGMQASSTADSSFKANGSYSERMAQHTRNMSQDNSVSYDGSTLSQSGPSQDRWAALKGQAANNLASNSPDQRGSPRQSETRSPDQERHLSEESIKLGASGLPDVNDPLPEIGHFDDTKSELSTNPSIIQGPLGGDASGKETWPYTPSPSQEREAEGRRASGSSKGDHGKTAAGLGAGIGAAGAIAMAKSARSEQAAQYEDDRLTPDTRRYGEEQYQSDGKLTPDTGRYHGENIDRNATPTSPAMPRDEGYDTAHDRSAGALTPKAEQQHYGSADIEAFNKAMNGADNGNDPFLNDPRQKRHVSGGSHGMASPLYDSATGKGMDHIQSKDIVALMDHLTVRDAQRNARDTEILVSLVRSAAEMRQNFEEMKHFIKNQDQMIMANTDRDAEQTVQRVLGGPRPQPPSSPRTPRQSHTSSEDVQTKRKGVLSRALRGLKGNKNASASDLARIEDMLMQVLDNVEDLKHQGVIPARQPMSTFTNDYTNETNESLDSYEKLRSAPDPGYEPEGNAGTGSTPSHSGGLSVTTRGDKSQFHSGYNGRPGSVNRVSTVMEGDEEEDERYYDDDDSYLQPHERDVLENQFENNEKLLTPTQEMRRGFTPTHTPPQRGTPGSQGNDLTPRTAEKERKHKSNSSSIFAGIPKISRWSKTTSSSAAPDPASVDSPNVSRNQRPISRGSRASSMHSYDSEDFLPNDGDDHSSYASTRDRGQYGNPNAETRSMRSQGSRITRTPSPLIPSEASYNRDDDYGYPQSQAQAQQQRQMPPRSPVQQVADFDEPEFDDPKYQAHRNSLLLQHPQPRQGPTSRHQNTLEDQAHMAMIDDGVTSSTLSQQTVSDFDPANWGSAGAGALNRARLPTAEPTSSPASIKAKPDLSPAQPQPTAPAPAPQQAPPNSNYNRYEDEEDDDWEPQYSNSGFARNYNSYSGGSGAGMYYSSPLGSGHLLEPIQEVRYSLETDSGHVSSSRTIDQILSTTDLKFSADLPRAFNDPKARLRARRRRPHRPPRRLADRPKAHGH